MSGDGRPDDPEPEIADALGLFRDDAPKPATGGANPPPASRDDESYDLVDPADPAEGSGSGTAPPVSPPHPAPIPERSPRERKPEDRKAPPDAVAPWSRKKEWGIDLIRVGLALIGTFLLVGFLIERGSYSWAFLAFLAGGLIALVLSYPMLITLEVPVRMTPEQALKDYYGALNHGRPHFRRMWLLLSRAGRKPFENEAAFRRYWAEQLASLSGGKRPSWNRLTFRVEGFRAPKSHGLEVIDARYEVTVSAGDDSPIRAFSAKASLVRGSDRHWYLDDGRLGG